MTVPLYAEIDLERLPRHVAIIMDGNGRWAKQHKVKVALGHRTGTETLREIIRSYMTALGILLQDGGGKRLPDLYQSYNTQFVKKAEYY